MPKRDLLVIGFGLLLRFSWIEEKSFGIEEKNSGIEEKHLNVFHSFVWYI